MKNIQQLSGKVCSNRALGRSRRQGFYWKKSKRWPCTTQAEIRLLKKKKKTTLTSTSTHRNASLTPVTVISFQQPLHSHTVEVNELTLALVALGGQEVFVVFDLVRQLWVQSELCWKLGDPVPVRENKGFQRERGRKRVLESQWDPPHCHSKSTSWDFIWKYSGSLE